MELVVKQSACRNHTTLCHLYIHKMEMPPFPELAFPATDRLPDLAHTLHICCICRPILIPPSATIGVVSTPKIKLFLLAISTFHKKHLQFCAMRTAYIISVPSCTPLRCLASSQTRYALLKSLNLSLIRTYYPSKVLQ
ncbi:hypothetical protein BDV36DRAFT_249955 [Aspergillus pseudocaelatus]|uniref:Uncharacterized protein n=1 Tax=Aspergillus pseudocaelatus TaxID=1825620 RepID=A0ABQ6WT50_9EURO|nr:hypothetical protein BDV36DRAFT_249955 [Aspergillus pseudocaelatus]